jgi:hypothetical protein
LPGTVVPPPAPTSRDSPAAIRAPAIPTVSGTRTLTPVSVPIPERSDLAALTPKGDTSLATRTYGENQFHLADNCGFALRPARERERNVKT